ncbi:DUF2784 domain-containing protein [Geobacter sp. AOG1]|uniref:DUF2784 domain-containing protein n=1 Tax=Geobacter sp. AOG1 TaxID=1566346 RepID=UPI001CC4E963|nr:DUF2784 domain-containing protein [Geobacter sp. AOG1]GFE56835.1 hypothetical protein AOG1_07140 [Geobacter sp. AOG1]
MPYLVLADLIVLVHAFFVLFVLLGGVAVLRWRCLAWLHLPAAIWGVAIEMGGWVCPLTFVENRFRRLGGEAGYGGTFIERYLEPLLYPLGLTRNLQIVFGLVAILVNLAIYASLWRRSPHNRT